MPQVGTFRAGFRSFRAKIQEHLHDTKAPENDRKKVTELCDEFEKDMENQPKTLAVTDLSLEEVMKLFGLTHETLPAQTLWYIKPSEMMDLPHEMSNSSFSIHAAILRSWQVLATSLHFPWDDPDN